MRQRVEKVNEVKTYKGLNEVVEIKNDVQMKLMIKEMNVENTILNNFRAFD